MVEYRLEPVRSSQPAPSDSLESPPLAEPNRFVGRTDEVQCVRRWLAEGARVVSVTGPAGVGKTRLARHVAAIVQQSDMFPGGVYECDLRGARDAETMALVVARRIGLGTNSGFSASDASIAVGRVLASRPRTLLLLDSVEQLLPGAASVVAGWIAAGATAHFLMVSRDETGIAGERRLELRSLRTPTSDPAPPRSEALELFFDRLAAARPDFVVDERSERGAAALVRRLNGLPLAIEMAASGVADLPAERLAQALGGTESADAVRTPRRSQLPKDPSSYHASMPPGRCSARGNDRRSRSAARFVVGSIWMQRAPSCGCRKRPARPWFAMSSTHSSGTRFCRRHRARDEMTADLR